MRGVAPERPCVYCGRERSGDGAARCVHCGRDAAGALWWREADGWYRPPHDPIEEWRGRWVPRAYGVGASAFVPWFVAQGAYGAAVAAIAVAGGAALMARLQAPKSEGHATERWRFATPAEDWVGGATIHPGVGYEAWGDRAEGRPVEVPAAARSITAHGIVQAGGAALREGFRRAGERLRRDLPPAPSRGVELALLAALVGMAARGSVALHRQRGWHVNRSRGVNDHGIGRGVGVALRDAGAESLPFEREVVDLLARWDAARGGGLTAHANPGYRDGASHPEPGCYSVFDVRDALARHEEAPVEAGVGRPVRAAPEAEAFAAFCGAQPDVLWHLTVGVAGRQTRW